MWDDEMPEPEPEPAASTTPYRRPGAAREILDAVGGLDDPPLPTDRRSGDGSDRRGRLRFDRGPDDGSSGRRRTGTGLDAPAGSRGNLPWIVGGALLPFLLALVLVVALGVVGGPGAPANAGGSPAASAPTDSPEPTVEITPSPTPEPTPTPSATPSPSPTPLVYVVKSGDSLSLIAGKYGVTVDALAAANGIAIKSLLRIGQQLVIPGH